jgi:acetyl-CoA carboxylase biotin carboxyl carrier protein
MELEEIKEIIDLLKDTDVTELSIERDGVKFRIKKERYLQSSGSVQSMQHLQPQAMGESDKHGAKKTEDKNLVNITSPIVGVFYSASSPDSPAFVEVGNRVEKGQVLCIVEAMKLMNEIESDTDGIIKEILPSNGQPVEYGETLFLIEPLS